MVLFTGLVLLCFRAPWKYVLPSDPRVVMAIERAPFWAHASDQPALHIDKAELAFEILAVALVSGSIAVAGLIAGLKKGG